jgi:dihydroorotase
LIGLQGRGTLAAGSYADVVVFAPHSEWSYSAKASRSRSKNTPFDGVTMVGQIAATLSNGRVIFRG